MEDVIDLSKKVPPFYNEIDYSHIMWIDSDIIFQPEDIMKLLSHDLDIVSGLYHLTPDTYSVVKLGQENFSHDSELVSKDLIEAKSVGTGFLLVKKGVFEKIERPWFQTGEIEEDGKKKFLGEDIYFCLKARKAGFKIFADPTIRVNHLKLGYL
jgi:GT2 family glycosyltransferase